MVRSLPSSVSRATWLQKSATRLGWACIVGGGALLPLAGALLPSVALADEGTPEDNAVAEARRRMEKGQQLFAEEKFPEAMAEFEAAYKVQPYKAFLYNAAVAAERSGDRERAMARYKEFLDAEPNAPDAGPIRATIERLKKEDRAAPPTAATEVRADIRSVVIILSEPKGAPVSIYERLIPTAPLFDPSKTEQPGWQRVAENLVTPADIPLRVGTYHIQVQPFRDFNGSGTDLRLEAGTVYVFKSNLSQGAIVGKVQVKTPVAGAKIYVDDPLHKNAPLGTAPGTVDLSPGKHKLSIEAPGYQPFVVEVVAEQGKMREIQADLLPEKVGYLVVVADSDEYTIKVDGVSRGVQQRAEGPFRLRLDAGPHQVVVDAKGRHAYAAKVDIPGGKDLPFVTTLNETGGKGGGVATAILSAGAIAGGATLWALSSKQSGDDQKNFRIGAGACFGGAALFAGLSAFFFVRDPSDPSTAKIGPPREHTPDPVPGAPTPKTTAPGPTAPTAAPPPKKTTDLGPIWITPIASPQAAGVSVFGSF